MTEQLPRGRHAAEPHRRVVGFERNPDESAQGAPSAVEHFERYGDGHVEDETYPEFFAPLPAPLHRLQR